MTPSLPDHCIEYPRQNRFPCAYSSGSLRRSLLLLLTLLCLLPLAQATPSDAEIQALLRAHVEQHRFSPGVVVGIVQGGQRRLFAHGEDGRGNPVHADSLFELGSITKLFTALLLADAVANGEVTLDTTLGSLHPGMELHPDVAAITLEQLAVHASGVPRLGSHRNMVWRSLIRLRDPYRGSTKLELMESLQGMSGDSLGSAGRFAYSNFGYAVLGQVLADRLGLSYEDAVQRRVLGHLDLHLQRQPEHTLRTAQGHRANSRPSSSWTLDAYAPAGASLGTVNALLDFAEQQLRPGTAGQLAQQPVLPFGSEPPRAMGLGWVMQGVGSETLYWHNGGTGGYRSFLGILPERDTALVVLANGAHQVDSLGFHLLGASGPPQARGSGWLWIVGTLLGMLLAPMNLLLALWRQRLQAVSGWQALTALVSALFVLAIFAKLGAWRELPFLLWWASAAISLSAAIVLLGRFHTLVWRAGTRTRRLAEQFYLGLLLALLVPVLGL